MADEEISRMRRVRRTCLEMLRDRKYLVDPAEIEMSKEEFSRKFVGPDKNVIFSQLTIVSQKADDEVDKIVVYFVVGDGGLSSEGKIGVQVLKGYLSSISDKSMKSAIFVTRAPMPPASKRAIAEFMSAKRLAIELFIDAELLVNITQHELVPQHVPLAENEKQQLLERYKLRDTQLPRMQISDPVARYFGLRRGQVVKIVRESETAGRYITYRLVF